MTADKLMSAATEPSVEGLMNLVYEYGNSTEGKLDDSLSALAAIRAYAERLCAPSEPGEALQVLRELVRLKDLHDKLEVHEFAGELLSTVTAEEYAAGKADYLKNKPAAWDRARALAAQGEPK